MLYQLFRVVQSTGVMALETHFDNPDQSPVLSKYPKFLKRKGSLAFLADSARVIIVGGISAHDFEHLMYEDLEVRHRTGLHAVCGRDEGGRRAARPRHRRRRARRRHHDAGDRRTGRR